MLILVGVVLVVVGLVITFGDRLPVKLGRLPGDFEWRGKNWVVYVPITTGILLSVILTVLLSLFNRR